MLVAVPLAHAASPSGGSGTLAPPVATTQLQDITLPSAHFMTHGACYDADERTLEGALAFMKAGPWGSMFATSTGTPGTCPGAGAGIAVARPFECYPNVSVHYTSHVSMWEHDAMRDQTLERFARSEGLSSAFARRLTACSCHPESEETTANNATEGLCLARELGLASFVHTDMRNGTSYGMMCTQGPWKHQLAFLATLKSSPLLMLHTHDALRPVGCEHRGYPAYLGVATAPMPTFQYGDSRTLDHCYPPSTLWAREEINATNPDVARTMAAEEHILGNVTAGTARAFISYAQEHALNLRVLDSTPECNCLPGSGIENGTDPGAGPGVPAMCNRSTAPRGRFSPMRDWWHGYPDTPAPLDPESPQREAIMAYQAAYQARMMLRRASTK